MTRLISARDMAARAGMRSVRDWMLARADELRRSGRFQVMWDGEHVGGAPVLAFIDFGRWGARCECGQQSYVDPDEPVLFCLKCGNGNSGLARPVLFPSAAMRAQIEKLLMERPVIEHPQAKDEIEAARLARPVYGFLPRSWYPSQPVEHLIEMNAMLGGT